MRIKKGYDLNLDEEEVVLVLRGLIVLGIFSKYDSPDDTSSSKLWHKITKMTRVRVENDFQRKKRGK